MDAMTQVSLAAAPHEILTTRFLSAPPDLVWCAFTESGHVEQWWGPVGFRTTTHTMAVQAGGQWRHTLHGPDGRDYPNRVAYTRVEAPALLEWAHDDGSDGPPMFHVQVTMEPRGHGTFVTLRHIFASREARDLNIATYGSVQGVIDTTNRLAGYLVAMPDERDFLISRDFEAPRALLWQAWTDERHLVHWWGPALFMGTTAHSDTRVGGGYRITMIGPFPGPGDTAYPVAGEYLEVTEPERLVMTVDCAEHPPAWHEQLKPSRGAEEPNPAGTMVQTVNFEALGAGRTRLTIRTRMVSAEIRAAMQRMGMQEGWAESLQRLATMLSQWQSSAPA